MPGNDDQLSLKEMFDTAAGRTDVALSDMDILILEQIVLLMDRINEDGAFKAKPGFAGCTSNRATIGIFDPANDERLAEIDLSLEVKTLKGRPIPVANLPWSSDDDNSYEISTSKGIDRLTVAVIKEAGKQHGEQESDRRMSAMFTKLLKKDI